MPPARMIGPSKNDLTARTKANPLDQPVCARSNRFARMTDRRDIGEHPAADLMQGWDHLRGRPDARDHHFRPMPHDAIEVLMQSFAPHDQIGAERRIVRAKSAPDMAEPLVQHCGGATIRDRKRSDDSSLAGSNHQLGPRHPEHRRSYNRQFQSRCDQGIEHCLLSMRRCNISAPVRLSSWNDDASHQKWICVSPVLMNCETKLRE